MLRSWPTDVASNHGHFGKFKDFGDTELKAFVTEYSFLRALDVRQSQVTSEGIIYLKNLQHLEWLWRDRNQSTEAGLTHLSDLSSLRAVWLHLQEIESDIIKRLRVELPECTFDDSSLEIEALPLDSPTIYSNIASIGRDDKPNDKPNGPERPLRSSQ